ncbi:extracellular solute-binding protein [Acetanaerobacterium elongatum]|uniref:Cyclodextrin-binding protein n=1 Tax=Acetanaerobacterium elongatum TaxID=258515 RepID=A0A1G9W2U6_9FIRM|nr:extracellular solute-binding protein [Acetanaerobacterium elongatum]SDM78516.1 cyclodextrin-binding protein [Acetanaerobacterium elongatum]
MKRVVAVILSALMLLTLFGGCAQSAAPATSSADNAASSEVASSAAASYEKAKEPVTVTIWHECDATIAQTIQDELNKLAPDIVVKVERKEKMSEALKLVGNDPASAPDMYFFAHDKIGLFAEMGILAPITDFITKEDLSSMIPMTIPAGTYKENIYQLPLYFETLLFMYNKALMKEVPKTTDDLLAYMKANTKNGSYGYVEQHSTAYYTAGWMQGFGGFIINDKAEPGLNKQEMIDAVTYHQQFVKYMPADGEYNTVTTLFKEGKAHSIISGPWLVPDVKKAGIDLGIAPMPTINSTNKPITPFSGVQGVSVLKSAAQTKKDAITAILKQLLKPDIGIALAKAANCAPANTKCYDDASISANEMIVAMKKTADNVVPMPNVPAMDVMWSITENMLSAVNKNNADPKTECEKAQKEALSQIEAMK